MRRLKLSTTLGLTSAAAHVATLALRANSTNPNGNIVQQIDGAGSIGHGVARTINRGHNYCTVCQKLVGLDATTCVDHNQRLSNLLATAHKIGWTYAHVTYTTAELNATAHRFTRELTEMHIERLHYVQRHCPSLYGWSPEPLYENPSGLPSHVVVRDKNNDVDLLDTPTAISHGLIERIETPYASYSRPELARMVVGP